MKYFKDTKGKVRREDKLVKQVGEVDSNLDEFIQSQIDEQELETRNHIIEDHIGLTPEEVAEWKTTKVD